jgi:hypothetical protein
MDDHACRIDHSTQPGYPAGRDQRLGPIDQIGDRGRFDTADTELTAHLVQHFAEGRGDGGAGTGVGEANGFGLLQQPLDLRQGAQAACDRGA